MSALTHAPADQSVGAPDPGPGPDQGASISDLVSRLGDDATALFRQEVELTKVLFRQEVELAKTLFQEEVELAKEELQQEVAKAARAGAMLGAAAVVGLVTLMLLAWTVAWGLAVLVPIWAAFLITTVLFGAIAGALAMVGKKRMEEVDLTPRRTIESLQQDKQTMDESLQQDKQMLSETLQQDKQMLSDRMSA